MSADRREPDRAADGLEVTLDRQLPAELPVGPVTAVFCSGTCFHREQRMTDLAIAVNGSLHRPTAQRMPRLDRLRELHPTLAPGQARAVERDPDSPEDPELHSYRSGFWATVPIEARERPGELELSLEARLADGTTARAPLAAIDVVERPEPWSQGSLSTTPDDPPIAICMATFDPPIELFRTQVDSIRAQNDPNWICLISDDCSEPEKFEEIAEIVADDERFVLSRAERHLSFYRNFERAIGMVPAGVEFIALSDQDDYWYPDKLEALQEAIESAELAYSDVRRVDVNGKVRAETLWQERRNNHTNIASLLISNTIVGGSCMFRRRVMDHALPFPSGPGWDFHDHWLALVAMALGEIAYVDRPLYDQVQHPGAVLGHVGANQEQSPPERRPGLRDRIAQRRGFMDRWRSAYFSLYLHRDFHARLLLARCGAQLTRGKRRALRRMVRAAHSPLALAWLASRPVRALFGRNETLRLETVLVRGILWRYLIALRTIGQQRPGGSEDDASLPGPVAQKLVPRQRRWLARR